MISAIDTVGRMDNMMKKVIALFLTFATLMIMLVACADGGVDPGATDAASEVEETTQLDNIPEDLKFNEEDITILNRGWVGWT